MNRLSTVNAGFRPSINNQADIADIVSILKLGRYNLYRLFLKLEFREGVMIWTSTITS